LNLKKTAHNATRAYPTVQDKPGSVKQVELSTDAVHAANFQKDCGSPTPRYIGSTVASTSAVKTLMRFLFVRA